MLKMSLPNTGTIEWGSGFPLYRGVYQGVYQVTKETKSENRIEREYETIAHGGQFITKCSTIFSEGKAATLCGTKSFQPPMLATWFGNEGVNVHTAIMAEDVRRTKTMLG